MHPFILPKRVPEQSDKKNSFLKELIIDLTDRDLDLINLKADETINSINENIISILEKLYKSDKNRKFNKIELENILQYLTTNQLTDGKSKDIEERFYGLDKDKLDFLNNPEYCLVALNQLLNPQENEITFSPENWMVRKKMFDIFGTEHYFFRRDGFTLDQKEFNYFGCQINSDIFPTQNDQLQTFVPCKVKMQQKVKIQQKAENKSFLSYIARFFGLELNKQPIEQIFEQTVEQTILKTYTPSLDGKSEKEFFNGILSQTDRLDQVNFDKICDTLFLGSKLFDEQGQEEQTRYQLYQKLFTQSENQKEVNDFFILTFKSLRSGLLIEGNENHQKLKAIFTKFFSYTQDEQTEMIKKINKIKLQKKSTYAKYLDEVNLILNHDLQASTSTLGGLSIQLTKINQPSNTDEVMTSSDSESPSIPVANKSKEHQIEIGDRENQPSIEIKSHESGSKTFLYMPVLVAEEVNMDAIHTPISNNATNDQELYAIKESVREINNSTNFDQLSLSDSLLKTTLASIDQDSSCAFSMPNFEIPFENELILPNINPQFNQNPFYVYAYFSFLLNQLKNHKYKEELQKEISELKTKLGDIESLICSNTITPEIHSFIQACENYGEPAFRIAGQLDNSQQSSITQSQIDAYNKDPEDNQEVLNDNKRQFKLESKFKKLQYLFEKQSKLSEDQLTSKQNTEPEQLDPETEAYIRQLTENKSSVLSIGILNIKNDKDSDVNLRAMNIRTESDRSDRVSFSDFWNKMLEESGFKLTNISESEASNIKSDILDPIRDSTDPKKIYVIEKSDQSVDGTGVSLPCENNGNQVSVRAMVQQFQNTDPNGYSSIFYLPENKILPERGLVKSTVGIFEQLLSSQKQQSPSPVCKNTGNFSYNLRSTRISSDHRLGPVSHNLVCC